MLGELQHRRGRETSKEAVRTVDAGRPGEPTGEKPGNHLGQAKPRSTPLLTERVRNRQTKGPLEGRGGVHGASAPTLEAEELPKLRARISEVEAEALVNTGSAKSFIRPGLAEVAALGVER